MRRPFSAALLLVAAATACTTDEVGSGSAGTLASAESAARGPVAHGMIRHGESFATMSGQYAPRAGPVAATGASAWVPPAPAPAFVASGPMPPADPPAPDPIEAAIRQSAARPAAAAAPGPALRTAGLALFGSYSCGTCHAFADAKASGAIGPSLDRNPPLTRALALDVIAHGRGAMPSFAGQMSDAEIGTLADYLVAFARK